MLKKCALTAVFLTAFMLVSVPRIGAQTRVRVRFARGASSAAVRGRVAGYKYVDYIIGVRRGQTISFVLTTSGSAEGVLFTDTEQNVPGGDGVLDYSGTAGYTGDYKIRILQPRAFARRNNASNYTLRISIE